jgi:hypothetical protein
MVCKHASAAHGLSAREYKMAAGLPLSIGIVGPSFRDAVRSNGELMGTKTTRLTSIDRSSVPTGGNTDGYSPDCATPLKTRALRSREESHAKALAKWSGIREDFVSKWLSGTPIKDMQTHYGVGAAYIRLLRDVFGLPPRLFPRWVNSSVPSDSVMTVRQGRRVRAQPAQPLPCSPSPAS